MKAFLLISALAAAGGAGAFALAGRASPKWSNEHLDRIRGTDAYYEEGQDQASVGPFEVRLRGAPPMVMMIGITFSYRRGLETADVRPLLATHKKVLLDRLGLHLCNLRREDFDDARELFKLKRDLRRILEAVLFPKGEARVERVWFDPFWFQVLG